MERRKILGKFPVILVCTYYCISYFTKLLSQIFLFLLLSLLFYPYIRIIIFLLLLVIIFFLASLTLHFISSHIVSYFIHSLFHFTNVSLLSIYLSKTSNQTFLSLCRKKNNIHCHWQHSIKPKISEIFFTVSLKFTYISQFFVFLFPFFYILHSLTLFVLLKLRFFFFLSPFNSRW